MNGPLATLSCVACQDKPTATAPSRSIRRRRPPPWKAFQLLPFTALFPCASLLGPQLPGHRIARLHDRLLLLLLTRRTRAPPQAPSPPAPSPQTRHRGSETARSPAGRKTQRQGRESASADRIPGDAVLRAEADAKRSCGRLPSFSALTGQAAGWRAVSARVVT